MITKGKNNDKGRNTSGIDVWYRFRLDKCSNTIGIDS
jgi:hypothetical protein